VEARGPVHRHQDTGAALVFADVAKVQHWGGGVPRRGGLELLLHRLQDLRDPIRGRPLFLRKVVKKYKQA
jgi:hypothetical protein